MVLCVAAAVVSAKVVAEDSDAARVAESVDSAAANEAAVVVVSATELVEATDRVDASAVVVASAEVVAVEPVMRVACVVVSRAVEAAAWAEVIDVESAAVEVVIEASVAAADRSSKYLYSRLNEKKQGVLEVVVEAALEDAA